jgi:nucleoside-diphosphate-sugar epimerase
MDTVLVTGANGFIGFAIMTKLQLDQQHRVRVAVRKSSRPYPDNIHVFDGLELAPNTDWTNALSSVDVVIHCAARAHLLRDTSADPLADFRRVNTEGTLNLALQAAQAGVKRFIFLSSLGVNGAETTSQPFTASDIPSPHSPYAQSKLEAEVALLKLAQKTGMSMVIVRPPLVYGPNAPGNFGALCRLVLKGLPLPLGSINNRRSFISVDNLVDLICRCIDHPNAVNQVLLASDGEDLSTTELLKKMGVAFEQRLLLVPIPVPVLKLGAQLLGKSKQAQQLLGSLQADIDKTRLTLDWKPPFSVEQGLRKTAKYWQKA